MKIIINADDFGYSSDVNKAIEHAMKIGLISSTTMLVNMSGFEEGILLAKSEDFIERVGIHLNLFEGAPLTKEIQNCPIFCDKNGIFHGKKIRFYDPLIMKSSIIYNELFAQIDKAVKSGIRPTHLDSHAHRHTNYFIGNIVIKLAKQFNIPSIRIHPNLNKRKNILSKMMVTIYNVRLTKHGIKCVDYVGSIPEIKSTLPKLKGIIEVIAHPVYKNGTILDSEYNSEITQLLSPFEEFEKITYAEL